MCFCVCVCVCTCVSLCVCARVFLSCSIGSLSVSLTHLNLSHNRLDARLTGISSLRCLQMLDIRYTCVRVRVCIYVRMCMCIRVSVCMCFSNGDKKNAVSKITPQDLTSDLGFRRQRLLNLRTELFRPLWTHQRSTEKMRPDLIAMKNKFSKARFNPFTAS